MRLDSFAAQVILPFTGMLLALLVVLSWDGASERPLLSGLMTAAFAGLLPVPLNGRAIKARISLVAVTGAGVIALWFNPGDDEGYPPWWVTLPALTILLAGVATIFVPAGIASLGALQWLRARWSESDP